MESSIVFETSKGNSYLYDNNHSMMINCHPVLHDIISVSEKGNIELFDSIRVKYPHLSNEEYNYYYQKFLFFKESGLFEDINMKEHLSGRISSAIVEEQIANVDDVVFQVTNLCNLSCVYCCYGDLYDNTGRDTLHNTMDFSKAQKVIDYLVEKWNSNSNLSHNGNVMIGFYGGEPLVNFSLIKQIVEYTQTLRLENNATFLYTMTTNSILLDKYMDFLVKYDFSLLLSLDGNEIHNSLRIDKSGKASFRKVFENIKFLQKKYPDYFERKVRFNSVLNRYSSVKDIQKFIFEEFGKTTGIEAITYSGIKPDKRDDFLKIFKNYSEEDEDEDYTELSSRTKEAGFFFYYHIGNAYRHYIELLNPDKKNIPRIPTGTCLPFWKKMFITPGGKIYACERIGFQHVLGEINEKVEIDSEMIAQKYNQYYDDLSKQCAYCYQAESCPSCMMQFELVKGKPVCPSITSKKRFKEYLSDIMSYLEVSPDIYDKVNKMIFA